MLRFLGIGAQKAGTSWLYENLAQHPQIRFPAGKEVHFWDLPCRYDRGLAWYRSLFPEVSPGVVSGEITPAYAILPPAKIREVHAAFPDLRLVYILRNPVDRAWSSALMALARVGMRFEEASDAWFLDHFRSLGSLLRGNYAACLEAWLAHYTGEALLVLKFEEILYDPLGLLRRCERHLGVDEILTPAVLTSGKVFSGSGHVLRAPLRAALLEIYDDKITALETVLGEDFSHWRR